MILLDFTPLQAEFIASLIIKGASKERKWAETIFAFMASRTNKFQGVKDVASIYRTLVQLDDKAKLKFASKKLIELMENNRDRQADENSSSIPVKANQKMHDQATAEDIEESICATFSMREIGFNYKSSDRLAGDCALIRASQSLIVGETQGFGEDLCLESLVEGQVDLTTFEGHHYTFLDKNCRDIGLKITNYLSR